MRKSGKHTLQRRVQNPLAMKLLEGAFRSGDTIEVAFESGQFQFRARLPERTPEQAHA